MIFSFLESEVEDAQTYYSEDERLLLDKNLIPYHVAIIPDGNRRWAKSHFTGVDEGHRQGAETLITTVRAAKEMGIKVLTVYTFSTENWSRPQFEINAVMQILEQYLKGYQQKLVKLSIRVSTIGKNEHLPASLLRVIEETKEMTKHCTEFDLVLALNYGGRDEICRAIRKIVNDSLEKKIHPQELTEELISQYLDTSSFPDPDLLIRASGEKRISNFLLWQSSYTEIYTEEVVWPSFTPKHLFSAVLDFQRRNRRFGGGKGASL